MNLGDGKPGVLGTSDESREYSWRFVGRKLYELNITPKASVDTAHEIDLLVEKYGQPTESKTAVYQNSYGAKWECPEVFWSMPDGTSIYAGEYIGADYYG